MESILEVLTPDNLIFIFKGFGLTIYISLIAIVLSTLIGTVLAVMRNGKNPIFAHYFQHLYRVCAQRSQPPLDFHYLFSFQDEIHSSRYYCLYPLYISSPS